MGLFGRKSAQEKYQDTAEQERLANVRRDEEHTRYVEDHAGPWIQRLAAARNGDNRCSEEVYKGAGDPGWPSPRGDFPWFRQGVSKMVRHEENRAKVDANFEADPGASRRLHDEVEFWMSVGRLFDDECYRRTS